MARRGPPSTRTRILPRTPHPSPITTTDRPTPRARTAPRRLCAASACPALAPPPRAERSVLPPRLSVPAVRVLAHARPPDDDDDDAVCAVTSELACGESQPRAAVGFSGERRALPCPLAGVCVRARGPPALPARVGVPWFTVASHPRNVRSWSVRRNGPDAPSPRVTYARPPYVPDFVVPAHSLVRADGRQVRRGTARACVRRLASSVALPHQPSPSLAPRRAIPLVVAIATCLLLAPCGACPVSGVGRTGPPPYLPLHSPFPPPPVLLCT
ncbi:hypothetical protein C8Q79DRAFT_937031 [Trametes meyenii]|nr:hypothetical protein C8Q79DRAFT_937031 [Trametes meyenii]